MIGRATGWLTILGAVPLLALAALAQTEWTPLAVADDPLVRLPGTQPGQVTLEGPSRCLNCHDDFDPISEPGSLWRGSMMAQAARDPIFWAAVTVAAQDSIWAVGRPNGTDLCLRCHMPEGWLEGRSDPTNGSALAGDDFDGVHCDSCHQMFDPFFESTWDGSREGDDWLGYWDETGLSDTPSQPAADATRLEDQADAGSILLFNGEPFYLLDQPFSPLYTENTGGQYFVGSQDLKRGSFADANATHQMLYSRYHKSRFYCGTCHDVSNPLLANLALDGTPPGDGVTVLPSEEQAAATYFHVERTFSEFMLSAYAESGGAPGLGPFAPDLFDTSKPGNLIGSCQDCHLRDVRGKAADKNGAVLRPDESLEHPASGVPQHDMTGGNMLVGWLLASAVPGSPNYDPVNESLLAQGPEVLTLDLDAGLGLDPYALLAAVDRARWMLESAAAIEDPTYDPMTGALSLRLQNQTGHKLISGFPEGRRMWLTVRAYSDDSLIWEINPYDDAAATLKGLPHAPGSPPLDADEVYLDELVYEMHPSSTLTGENESFHFVLADGRYKDNRIPPAGFRTAEMAARLIDPRWQGAAAADYFTAEEYAGGYDQIDVTLPAGADEVEIALYYQTISREYAEFLRDEINGTADTLPPDAYVAQTDPFFDQLRAWGDIVWQLWEYNQAVPGAAPVLMVEAEITFEDGLELNLGGSCPGIVDLTISGATANGDVVLVRGADTGSFVVPTGQCAGTALDLSMPQLIGTLRADTDGDVALAPNLPQSACDLHLQGLDLTSCETTDAVPVP